MAKVEHITDKHKEILYPITKERAVYDDNGIALPEKLAAFVTRSVNDLVNYYTKSETYTKAEVQALIAAIQQFHYEVYPSIEDVTNPSGNVLYLIGPSGSGTDKYAEYIYDESKPVAERWIKIGDTSIDLSNYVTIDALNTALGSYVTSTALETALAGLHDVKYTSQSLTDAQKAQARTNIGAGTYSVPAGGIPDTDLSTAVQTSLGLADTAVQPEAGKGLFSGNYNDLTNKPTIPSAPGTLDTTQTTAQSTSADESLSGNVKLHKVSKTGDYGDLLNTPTIPAAQVNSDWDAISGVAQILNKPTIPTVESMTAQEVTTAVQTAWDAVMV